MRGGRGPAMWASLLSVAAFAFFFVPPYLTCAVADMGSLVTVSIMLCAALVISPPTRAAYRGALCHEPCTRQHAQCRRSPPGRRASEFISIVVCGASHERRHHRWPVYGSPMCRLTPQHA